MKRILVLLCALLFLLDLADDGYLGKAPALTPQLPGTVSFFSSPDSSGTIVPQVWLADIALLGALQRWQNQEILVEVEEHLTKIDCYLLGSSGGLPL